LKQRAESTGEDTVIFKQQIWPLPDAGIGKQATGGIGPDGRFYAVLQFVGTTLA